jgi:hypothetical protein
MVKGEMAMHQGDGVKRTEKSKDTRDGKVFFAGDNIF